MNTLATERPRTEASQLEFKALVNLLIKAFGPAAAKERSNQEERALRRELWMLGGG